MFTDRYWPGTKRGCACDNNQTIYQTDKECGKDCIEIKREEKIQINTVFGKKICVNRSGSNILNAVRPLKSDRSQCEGSESSSEKTYQPCGSGDSSHEICVLSFNDCPIDDIVIDDQEEYSNYYTDKLGEGMYIHYTRQSDKLPIVDFTIAEGQVCIFPDEFDRPEDEEPYQLLRTWKYDGCKKKIGDLQYDEERWLTINQTTERELYTENKKIHDTIEELPNYELSNSTFTLFARTYIEWDLECQDSDEASMDKIASDNNPINTLANVQLIYVIIALLAIIVMGLISPGFIIYKQTRVLLGYREQDDDLIASNGMRLISGILVILLLCFLISALLIISNYKNIVDFVEKKHCTDATTLATLKYLRGVLMDAYDYNYMALWAAIVMAAAEIIATVWLCVLSCIVKRKEKKENNFMKKTD